MSWRATRIQLQAKVPRASIDDLCRALAQAAADNELPEVFTRLIWQESRFDPAAISPAGAQGIAQFMPQTAATRGLDNAFEPLQALRESASYLRELRAAFRGNLGLGAAAYNAGPGQVAAWLTGHRHLPGETRAYIRTITGHTAEAWVSQPPQWHAANALAGMLRVDLARLMSDRPQQRTLRASGPTWRPWVVQLAGTWSEARVLANYQHLGAGTMAVPGSLMPLAQNAHRHAPPTLIVPISRSRHMRADSPFARLQVRGGSSFFATLATERSLRPVLARRRPDLATLGASVVTFVALALVTVRS
ncbi:MAG: lytic transglycosylase domain-containing protein [Hyphomicrobiaceae bacterium]